MFVNNPGAEPLLPVRCQATSSDSEALSVPNILGYAGQVRIRIWFDERTGEMKLPLLLLNRVSCRKSNRASQPCSADGSFAAHDSGILWLGEMSCQVLTAGF